MNLKSALNAIEKHGILLVYPIANKSLPLSLWSYFFPGKKMDWKWDSSADSGVADMWHLRERLAASKSVVYAKWYQGRATFFSKEIFPAVLNRIHQGASPKLSREAENVLEILDEDSPRSMKDLRKELRSRGWNEKQTEKALKELWSKLLIVGLGEVNDGAFPSLLVGSTRLMWEGLWTKSQKPIAKFKKLEDSVFSVRSSWGRFLNKVTHQLPSSKKTKADPSTGAITYDDLVSRR